MTQNADTSQEKSARPTPQLKVNKIVYPGKQDVSFAVLDESGAIVCQTIMREIATEQELIAADEKHAKLFAAAPDMLDVLNGLWSGVSDFRRKALTDSNSQTLDDSAVQVPVLWGTLKKIATAIAKAEKP